MGVLAYWSSECKTAKGAKLHPHFKRIMHCGKWYFIGKQIGKKKGVLAFQGAEPPADLPDGVESPDGLIYYKPDPMPEQRDLAKEQPLPGHDYMTSKGHQLTIPLGVAGPRLIDFSNLQAGDFSDDFPKLCAQLEDQILDPELPMPMTGDANVLQVVFKAIEQTYRVTSELLGDLEWITTQDISPIIDVVMGTHPKLESGDVIMWDSLPPELNVPEPVLSESGQE